MKNQVFWKNRNYKHFPKLDKDIECDYLIVGGGITGVATAYFLKNSDKKVVLIERGSIASGATGMAAGILTPFAELDFTMIVEKIGKEKGLEYWKLLHRAQSEVIKIINEEKIDCDFELVDAIYAELHDKSAEKVIDEYKVHKGNHLRVKLLKHLKLDKYIHNSLFDEGILFHKTISLNPLAFTQELARALPQYGVEVYEDTSLEKIDGNIASTDKAQISFKKVILATDSFLHIKAITLIKTTIAVSSPLPKNIRKVLPQNHKYTLWDSKNDYDYIKFLPDNRLLVGLGDVHAKGPKHTSKLHLPHFNKIKKFTNKLIPGVEIEWEYAWSGIYGTTKDYLPLVSIKEDTITVAAPAGQLISVMLAQQVAQSLSNRSQKLNSLFN